MAKEIMFDMDARKKMEAGVNKLADAYREASDVNKDGVVDILDLLKIQKNILGATNIDQ